MVQLITSCRSWQLRRVIRARCWHLARPLPRLYMLGLIGSLSLLCCTFCRFSVCLGVSWHATAAHTPHSTTHCIHYWCRYSPHLMLFVGSFIAHVTNDHFHWCLNPDSSPLCHTLSLIMTLVLILQPEKKIYSKTEIKVLKSFFFLSHLSSFCKWWIQQHRWEWEQEQPLQQWRGRSCYWASLLNTIN